MVDTRFGSWWPKKFKHHFYYGVYNMGELNVLFRVPSVLFVFRVAWDRRRIDGRKKEAQRRAYSTTSIDHFSSFWYASQCPYFFDYSLCMFRLRILMSAEHCVLSDCKSIRRIKPKIECSIWMARRDERSHTNMMHFWQIENGGY